MDQETTASILFNSHLRMKRELSEAFEVKKKAIIARVMAEKDALVKEEKEAFQTFVDQTERDIAGLTEADRKDYMDLISEFAIDAIKDRLIEALTTRPKRGV